MNREVELNLQDWFRHPGRQPIILRGARQVGKTWLARSCARKAGLELLEINFERHPEYGQYFRGSDPAKIFDELSIAFDHRVAPERTLLFLDEIQAAPEVIGKLRWFAEEMPDLAVMAAGSLLEFALTELRHSMPVGRVGFLHVQPMTFPEYMTAHGQEHLMDRLETWSLEKEFSKALHRKLLDWYDRYQMVGGMPAVVSADVERGNAVECRRIQSNLVQSYREDFNKYAGRMDTRVLHAVMLAAAAQVGKRLVYSRVGEGVKHQQASHAMDLLEKARLCSRVRHSSGNGLPLAGEVNDQLFKTAFIDAGLLHGLWQTPASRTHPHISTLAPGLRGMLTEQMAAQQLSCLTPDPTMEPRLYYWQRSGGRQGEVDYLVENGGAILPVEVKSGSSGSLKSLHQFMFDKQLSCAVRLDRNPPSLQPMDLLTTKGDRARYSLLNLPHYMVSQIPRLTK